MVFAREVSVFNIEVEGDAEVILKVLLASDVSHLEYGHVISDILVLVAEFRFCCFSHIKHVGNSVTHFIARNSKFGHELQVWMESVLEDIDPLVLVIRDHV